MTKTSGIGSGAGLALGAVATVVVLGGGYFLARGGALGPGAKAAVERQLVSLGLMDLPRTLLAPTGETPTVAVLPEGTQTTGSEPDTTAPMAQETTAAEAGEAPAEQAFVLVAPQLELARFETDGSGLVAGAAQPGVEIEVLLDGDVLERLVVDEGGEFAAFVTIAPSDQPRVISLLARFDGEELASEDSFILAPVQLSAVSPDAVTAEAPLVTGGDEGSAAGAIGATVATPLGDQADAVPQATGSGGVATATEATQAGAASAPTIASGQESGADGAEDGTRVVTSGSAEAPSQTETTSTATVATQSGEGTVGQSVPATVPGTVATTSAPSVPGQPDAALGTGSAPVAAAGQVPLGTSTATASAEAPSSGVAVDGGEGAVVADAASAPQPDVAVTVLRAGRDGVTLVQPATPVSPDLLGKVALDTISYTDNGDVQLAGRAKPEALVRVYLDNSPVTEIAVETSGRWSGHLTSVAPGIYTLRLDEIDPVEGKVLSRLETPFKREAPEALRPLVAGDTPAAGAGVPARPAVQAVTVQKGDTLWAISQARYGNGVLYVRVFEANKRDIRDPNLIYPGQIFTLPE